MYISYDAKGTFKLEIIRKGANPTVFRNRLIIVLSFVYFLCTVAMGCGASVQQEPNMGVVPGEYERRGSVIEEQMEKGIALRKKKRARRKNIRAMVMEAEESYVLPKTVEKLLKLKSCCWTRCRNIGCSQASKKILF